MRFEMEMERMKQIHQKELEDKEEELEDVHKSSQRRVGQLTVAMAAFTPEGRAEVDGVPHQPIISAWASHQLAARGGKQRVHLLNWSPH